MRIFLLFLFPVFIIINIEELNAQANVYHSFPDSAIWRVDAVYNKTMMGFCYADYYYQYYISGDTLINSYKYKKIYRSFVLVNNVSCPPPYGPPTSPSSGYVGALKDDSIANKTFFLFPNTTTDSLLYDYNLNVGDTMKGFISQYPYGYNMVVLSIDSVLINGQYRKKWNFNKSFNDYPYIIEGIGTSCGLIEWVHTYAIDFTYRYLVCVNDSASLLFTSNYNSLYGCKLVVDGVSEMKTDNTLQVSPNPSSGIFSLSSLSKVFYIEISDILGNQVYKQRTPVPSNVIIDLSSQSKGIYCVKVVDEKGNFGVKKIIIQ
jgi:hypothetical protein